MGHPEGHQAKHHQTKCHRGGTRQDLPGTLNSPFPCWRRLYSGRLGLTWLDPKTMAGDQFCDRL